MKSEAECHSTPKAVLAPAKSKPLGALFVVVTATAASPEDPGTEISCPA